MRKMTRIASVALCVLLAGVVMVACGGNGLTGDAKVNNVAQKTIDVTGLIANTAGGAMYGSTIADTWQGTYVTTTEKRPVLVNNAEFKIPLYTGTSTSTVVRAFKIEANKDGDATKAQLWIYDGDDYSHILYNVLGYASTNNVIKDSGYAGYWGPVGSRTADAYKATGAKAEEKLNFEFTAQKKGSYKVTCDIVELTIGESNAMTYGNVLVSYSIVFNVK